jgi:hypothetical protein
MIREDKKDEVERRYFIKIRNFVIKRIRKRKIEAKIRLGFRKIQLNKVLSVNNS